MERLRPPLKAATVALIAAPMMTQQQQVFRPSQHRIRVARNPREPNLRQVHLIHAELHDELESSGIHVSAGQMGENVTTRGIDLLGLPAGTRLRLGMQPSLS